MSPDPVHPSDQLLQGLSKLGLVMRQASWEEAGRRGLHPTQQQALAVLRTTGRVDGRGMLLRELAHALGITPGTASESVAVLVDKGLIIKAADPDDARAIRLSLSPKGRRAADAAMQWPDQLLSAAAELSPEERGVFVRGLIKMIRSLQERGAIPVQRMCVDCVHFRPRVHADPHRPHHCALVDAAMGDGDLRVQCAEQQPMEAQERPRVWQVFVEGRSIA